MHPSQDFRHRNFIKTVMSDIRKKRQRAWTAWVAGILALCAIWEPNQFHLPANINDALAIAVVCVAVAMQLPVMNFTCPSCKRRYVGIKGWITGHMQLPASQHCGFDIEARAKEHTS